MMQRMMKMELKIQFDEEKMQELIEQAVEKLKAEGYIWRNTCLVLPDVPSTDVPPAFTMIPRE